MRRSAVATMAAGGLVTLALSGCSGIQELQHTGTTATTDTAAATTRSDTGTLVSPPVLRTVAALTPRAPSRLRSASVLPGVGATLSTVSRGAHLEVTLLRVIDPLRGSGAPLLPGDRAVAIHVRIASSGPELYDSSATGDFSLRASAGVVTPVLATRGICRTRLNDFDRYITAGETRSGCVVFAVPDRAVVTAVRFSPHAARAGRLSWAP